MVVQLLKMSIGRELTLSKRSLFHYYKALLESYLNNIQVAATYAYFWLVSVAMEVFNHVPCDFSFCSKLLWLPWFSSPLDNWGAGEPDNLSSFSLFS